MQSFTIVVRPSFPSSTVLVLKARRSSRRAAVLHAIWWCRYHGMYRWHFFIL